MGDVGDRRRGKLFSFEVGYGTGQFSLDLGAVSHDHDVVELLGNLDHGNVDLAPGSYGNLLSVVSQKGKYEDCRTAGNFDGIFAFAVRNRAGIASLDHHDHAGKRLPVFIQALP